MTIPVVPAGSEFLVNTQTNGGQRNSAVTGLTNGNFVVTWWDDGNAYAMKAQIFAADGSKVGAELRLSSFGNLYESLPFVASLAGGGFVVAFQTGGGSPSHQIDAQIYAANGSKIGSQFSVPTPGATTSQEVEAITGLANGGFVVTWRDNAADGNGYGVFAQVVAADGSKVGSQFLVNTATAGFQYHSTVTSLANGSFIVAWQDSSSGTLGDSSSSIKAQIFAANGSRIGSEFLVNTQTAGVQLAPKITNLANGGFVVTWQDGYSGGAGSGTLGDSSGASVKGQVFAADGSKVGTEFLVNTQTANDQSAPVVTALGSGFVITWGDKSGTLGDSSGTSIKAQVFAADGTKIGSEFLVNTQTANDQTHQTIASLGNGAFIVTWDDASGTLGDASGTSIKAQIFTLNTTPNTPTISDVSVANGYVNAVNDSAAHALNGQADAGSTVKIYLNGSATPSYTTTADANGTWRVTVGHLVDGTYSYVATATDLAGNTTPPSTPLNFIVDTVAPVLAITGITPQDGVYATVTGTIGGALAGQTVTLMNASQPTNFPWHTTTDSNGNWSISGVPLSVLGDNPIVAGYDAAGNPGATEYLFTTASPGHILTAGTTQLVFGTSVSTTVLDGAQQSVYAAGTANGTIVNVGGTQINWGTAVAATVSGGTQYVWGTADQTVVSNAGFQSVNGSTTNTTLNDGGRQNIYESGTATGTTINAGCEQVDWGHAAATMIDGGNQYVWGTATGTTIASGAQYVGAGGTADNTTIGNGGVEYVFAGGGAHDVTFGGSNALLGLEQSSAFSGAISGWQDGNKIDLNEIVFGGSTTLGYAANADNTGGTLTVSDGAHTATLSLLGQYSAADFALSGDGYGGTFVTNPDAAIQQSALALPNAA